MGAEDELIETDNMKTSLLQLQKKRDALYKCDENSVYHVQSRRRSPSCACRRRSGASSTGKYFCPTKHYFDDMDTLYFTTQILQHCAAFNEDCAREGMDPIPCCAGECKKSFGGDGKVCTSSAYGGWRLGYNRLHTGRVRECDSSGAWAVGSRRRTPSCACRRRSGASSTG